MGNPALPQPRAAVPLIVDLRRPGEPMAALPLKVPTATLRGLQARAEGLGTSRGALARMLLVQGLERLETAAASEVA